MRNNLSVSLPFLIFLLLSFVFSFQDLNAQVLSTPDTQVPNTQENNENQSEDDFLTQIDQVNRLVSFYFLNLNTLGDKEVSLADKDIIIRESYIKLFRDAKVQIEDDLDPERKTVTYKDVQAYLQDVNFFFKNAQFEFTITRTEAKQKEDGSPYFFVHVIRTLNAVGLQQDSLLNDQARYIEIDQTDRGLKIASVYTTKLNPDQERRYWWSALSPDWKMQLAGNASLIKGLPLYDITTYGPGILITASDTFLINGLGKTNFIEDSTAILFKNDTVFLTGLDSLPLSHVEIDVFLQGLTSQRSLDLSDFKQIEDTRPLAKLQALESLNLSGLPINELDGLRSLPLLTSLDISNTSITDLSALKYLRNLQTLNASSTQISNISIPLKELKTLNLSACPIDSLFDLSNTPQLSELTLKKSTAKILVKPPSSLTQLNISNSNIEALPGGLKGLKKLYANASSLKDINSLNQAVNLEFADLDDTNIPTLLPLSGIKTLKRINCDKTPITDQMAYAFQDANPNCLVIHNSTVLFSWWNALSAEWKKALLFQLGTESINTQNSDTLDRETLHKISRLDQLDLRSFKNITALLPLSQLSELIYLEISELPISNLNGLSALNNLESLSLKNCHIEDLSPLNSLPALVNINIQDAPINDLSPLLNCPNLKKIYADNSALTDSTVSFFKARRPDVLLVYRTAYLTEWWAELSEDWQHLLMTQSGLAISTNVPSGEVLEAFTQTENLEVKAGSITHLRPLSELGELRSLDISANQVRSIWPIASCKKIEFLNISDCPVEDIAVLEKLNELRVLKMNNTAVLNLSSLSHKMKLTEIECSGTQVRSLNPLALNLNLIRLDFANTKIKSLKPLDDMTSLEELIIFNTAIPFSKVSRFMAEHPDVDIKHY